MFPTYVAESEGIAWCSTSAPALAATLRSQLDTDADHSTAALCTLCR